MQNYSSVYLNLKFLDRKLDDRRQLPTYYDWYVLTGLFPIVINKAFSVKATRGLCAISIQANCLHASLRLVTIKQTGTTVSTFRQQSSEWPRYSGN